MEIPQRKGEPLVFDTDEHPRETHPRRRLAKLPAVFKEGGTVTAGNASGRNDGAACTRGHVGRGGAAARPQAAGRHPQPWPSPACRRRSWASARRRPAARRCQRAGLTFDDMGLIELNEAFAAQALAVIRELGIGDRMADINPNGGAIALGHPLGLLRGPDLHHAAPRDAADAAPSTAWPRSASPADRASPLWSKRPSRLRRASMKAHL